MKAVTFTSPTADMFVVRMPQIEYAGSELNRSSLGTLEASKTHRTNKQHTLVMTQRFLAFLAFLTSVVAVVVAFVVAFVVFSANAVRQDERERVKAAGARVMSMDQIEGLEPIHENWGDVDLGKRPIPPSSTSNSYLPVSQFAIYALEMHRFLRLDGKYQAAMAPFDKGTRAKPVACRGGASSVLVLC